MSDQMPKPHSKWEKVSTVIGVILVLAILLAALWYVGRMYNVFPTQPNTSSATEDNHA